MTEKSKYEILVQKKKRPWYEKYSLFPWFEYDEIITIEGSPTNRKVKLDRYTTELMKKYPECKFRTYEFGRVL